jgi:L-cysteine/cystine lyase
VTEGDARHRRYHTNVVSPFLPDAEKVAAVREALPATSAGIYLNTGSVGPLPRETVHAMNEISEWELRTGRGSPADVDEALRRMDEARAGIAAILSTDVDSIALTHSATDAMNIACWSVDWQAGDRAVTTRLEHAGGLGPLYTLRDRLDVELTMVDIGAGGDDDRTLAAFDEAIVPGTRLVALSHVTWSTGAVLPVARIAQMAHDRGAWLVLDGAQSAGAIPVDVGELGADFFAASAQKWLLGPEGMGALHVAPTVLERACQTFAGWFGYELVDSDGRARHFADARRFQTSGYHRPSVVGMARSCGWLSMYVGLDWVYRRGTALAHRAADLLAAIPGVELLTPTHQMATLVSFRIADWPAEAALEELGRRVFAIARTIPELEAIRLSVGFFNTEAELERLAEAVAELARATPATLSRRPALTILSSDAG